ncbi:MAG: aspartate kinase [Coriobacteriia bacterium]|nr:aspartate kinase [Coriobacteriia bacterium]
MSFKATAPVIVMKFGGTSVADAVGRAAIAQRVSATLESGKWPVVVVSAMGRTGAPYATDTLMGLVDGLPGELAEHDWLMATGEIISAIMCAHELRSVGIDARAFTGADAGIITDGNHGSSAIVEIHTERLVDAISQGQVPVVAGFQGVSVDGRMTTLGRGGSDTTACALGVALTAESVEIYTDVDGVATADPRVCPGAETLEVITADELFQMARHGSRVVHTPAAQLALASGLAVRVRNTFSDHPGTLVADIASYRPERVATAISHASGVARISVNLPASEGTAAHMAAQAGLYRAMADAGVSLDMFTPLGDTMVFSVGQGSLDSASCVLDGLGLAYVLREGLAKVTLVGAGMHGVPGVMATMAEALGQAEVTVLQTSDSHTTISVLIRAEDTDRAIEALHRRFELGS